MRPVKHQPSDPEILFGPTKDMKKDVIQAILNLERTNDPNFLKIREWLEIERQNFVRQAALSIMSQDVSNAAKGMAIMINCICGYLNDPKAILAAMMQAQSTGSGTGSVTGNP